MSNPYAGFVGIPASIARLLASALFLVAVPGQSQECEQRQEHRYEFYSGTVKELPVERVTVERQVVGKPAETRTFVLRPETKIEGKLSQRARVTVGYTACEEGDVAMRIIVRPSPAPGK